MKKLRDLAYDDQVARLGQVLDALLLRYRLQPAVRTLLQFENNAVFQLDGSDGARHVARIATPWGRTAQEQTSEMQWLETLTGRARLAVPGPVPNLEGGLVTPIAFEDAGEVYPCVILRWVGGELPTPGIALESVERLGTFAAHLHDEAQRFAPPPDFVRPKWDWERVFGGGSIFGSPTAMAALSPGQRHVLETAADRARRVMTSSRDNGFDQGLIHGDLHRDNIVIQNGEIGVIDFDDCGIGYFLYDLACVLDSFQRRIAAGTEEYHRQREALLRGYRKVRPLPADVDQCLAVLMAMRDMVTIDFILRSRNANVQGWGLPRIAGIIEQLRSRLDTGTSA